jgi:hypothetical protein
MTRSRKHSRATSDPFGSLKEAVADCFAFLTADFAFELLISTKTIPPECWIGKQKGTGVVLTMQRTE